ncbi:hypothetical protein Pint_33329 [Pistacia integerrima]|uniref:Uncharacterized protein n=1 Tax=Pistacia integerrima TaxID=434235 RepID=A0ACC0X3S7_9ROSI|nr:hypothetical protein Pint_33329 [Pistacia integerrima]
MFTTHKAIPNGSWIIDTGATEHIIHTSSLFTQNIVEVRSHVELPNGSAVLVTHIGSIRLSDTLVLTNVLCVPSFSFNLLSVSQLTMKQHCTLTFSSIFCHIQGRSNWNG